MQEACERIKHFCQVHYQPKVFRPSLTNGVEILNQKTVNDLKMSAILKRDIIAAEIDGNDH